MTRKEKALDRKLNRGYNCSQAVGCAFCEDVGIEESKMFQLMSAFGLGMGGMEGTCGAVSAGIAVMGLMMNNGNTEDIRQKVKIHKTAKEYTRRFAEKNASIVCRELKGAGTGNILRTCEGCVEDAVVILEEMMKEGLLQ